MSKIYRHDIDVDQAADQRLDLVFDRFERVCVSVSFGKESAALFWKGYRKAQERGRVLDVLFIDLEAQYQATIDLAHQIMRLPGVVPWWICLPLNLRNAVSSYEPHWCCWEPGKEEVWVRPIPEAPGVITDQTFFPFYTYRQEFETFVEGFAPWLGRHYGASLAQLVAIRSDESLNRYRAVKPKTGDKKSGLRLNGRAIPWTTVHSRDPLVVSAFPIYDWSVADVWTYIGRHEHPYNRIYDLMHLLGVPLSEMRICQPYGDDQRRGLGMWRHLEPNTWEKIVARVPGANFGARYAKEKLLGYHGGLDLPEGYTWRTLTWYLLSTLPEVERQRHLANFAVFLEWWSRHGFPDVFAIPEDGDPKDYGRRRIPTWRRLAQAIRKNDFNGNSLSIGAIKDVQRDVYDRVAAGLPIKVRRSVEPFYAMLRDEYARYCEGGIAALTIDMPTVTPHAQKIKEKYKDI